MWLLLLLAAAAMATPGPDSQLGRPVHLSEIGTLHLSADRDVYCHRACGPEIRNVGDDRAAVSSAVCTRVGKDWTCKLSGTQEAAYRVVCQGWGRPDDPWVAAGSCALEYRLKPPPGVWESLPLWPIALLAVFVGACCVGHAIGREAGERDMIKFVESRTQPPPPQSHVWIEVDQPTKG